jgi:hypothetical protein
VGGLARELNCFLDGLEPPLPPSFGAVPVIIIILIILTDFGLCINHRVIKSINVII